MAVWTASLIEASLPESRLHTPNYLGGWSATTCEIGQRSFDPQVLGSSFDSASAEGLSIPWLRHFHLSSENSTASASASASASTAISRKFTFLHQKTPSPILPSHGLHTIAAGSACLWCASGLQKHNSVGNSLDCIFTTKLESAIHIPALCITFLSP